MNVQPTEQGNGEWCIQTVPGRFPSRDEAIQAHQTHVERMRGALGREPTASELLHGPARRDNRSPDEKYVARQWEPVVTTQDAPRTVADEVRDYQTNRGISRTDAEFARSKKQYEKGIAEWAESIDPNAPAPEPEPDAARQSAVDFAAKLESEARYDPTLDATHIEALRRMRLQAEQGDLDHFKAMAEGYLAERDAAEDQRLSDIDKQIAALKARRSNRAALSAGVVRKLTEADVVAEPDPVRRAKLYRQYREQEGAA